MIPSSPTPDQDFARRRIVVLISGGIAAYKAADLVSRLKKAGAEVQVAMSKGACAFVAPLTFEALSGHPVYRLDLNAPDAHEMQHIAWARWAEAVVAPMASADMIAKFAHGLADDAPSTLVLAYEGPLWVAPSMNTAMLSHPATQANLRILIERGVHLIQPGVGSLACGEVGPGRMAEPEDILRQLAMEMGAPVEAQPVEPVKNFNVPAGGEAIQAAIARAKFGGNGHVEKTLAGKTVLITTGPTRESLDPIRFLSNRSTGRMGCELAAEAVRRGARVLLVHGPLSVALPLGVEAIPADSAREMLAAVQARWNEADMAIFAAAVANYESDTRAGSKLKGAETLTLELRRTPDIAAWCGANRQAGQVLIGFCAESEDLLERARNKMAAKQLDFICANPIGEEGIGFAADENQITLLGAAGEKTDLPRADKRAVAAHIWNAVLASSLVKA